MARTVSRTLFQQRVEYLVETQGTAATARLLGKSPEPVRRWRKGEQAPRSQAERVSVSKKARRRGAPEAVQLRRRGQFFIARSDNVRNVRSGIERARRRERTAMIEAGEMRNDERMLRMARGMRIGISQEELEALENRLALLMEGTPEPGDSWRKWDEDYEAARRAVGGRLVLT